MIKIFTCVADNRDRVYRADKPVLTVQDLDIETAESARIVVPLSSTTFTAMNRDYWSNVEPIATSLGQSAPRFETFEKLLTLAQDEIRSRNHSAGNAYCAEVVIRIHPGDIRMILVAYEIEPLRDEEVRLTSIPTASNTFGNTPIWNEHHMCRTDLASAEAFKRSIRHDGFVDAVEIATGGTIAPPILGSLIVRNDDNTAYISEAKYRSPSRAEYFAAVSGFDGKFEPLDVPIGYFVDLPFRSVWWISEYFEVRPVSQIAGLPLRQHPNVN